MDLTENHINLSIKRTHIAYFGLWLIIPFCSLISHTIVAIPPTLVLFLFASVILLLTLPRERIYSLSLIGFPLLVITYYLISQMFIGAPVDRFGGVILAISYFVIVATFGGLVSDEKLNLLIIKFINLSLVILTVECFWRMTHPHADYSMFNEGSDIRWIYKYKFRGIMYSDSNVVGFHIMCIFFFLLYLEIESGMKFGKRKLLFLVLLLFSFSRAAWLATAIGFIYVKFLRKKRIEFYLINLLILSVLGFLFFQFYLKQKITTDLSFQSKIAIARSVVEYFQNAPATDIIFGVGFSNSIEKLGIYAHNFFVVFLIESGVIGLLLVLLLFLHFIFVTKGKALYILVPFFISTLSNTVTFMPYFYMIMALIYLAERKKLFHNELPVVAANEN